MGVGAPAHLPPEPELLCAVAREQVHPKGSERELSPWDRDIDWEALLNLARRHRMRPILYRELERVPRGDVPSAVLAELAETVEETVRRNLYMAHESTAILDRFAEHGIRALTYKGPSLAVLAYGDLSLREFVDLDLLIPRESFTEAIDVLRSENYRVRRSFSGAGQKLLCERETGLNVDLHFSVSPTRYPFEFPFDDLWNRRITTDLTKTRTVQTLHPNDLLPVLAIHGTKHYWKRLEWLVSLAALVRGEGIEMADVLHRSEEMGCDRMVLLGLELARTLLDLPLPAVVSEAIDDEWLVRRASERVIDEVFRRDEVSPVESWTFHRSRHLLELLMMPGLWAKGRYGLRMGRSFL